MPALFIVILAGVMVGWLCRGHLWRAVLLSVPTSAASLGIVWLLRAEPQEVEAQWVVSQSGFWMMVYILFFLACAGGAATTSVLYRRVRDKGTR